MTALNEILLKALTSSGEIDQVEILAHLTGAAQAEQPHETPAAIDLDAWREEAARSEKVIESMSAQLDMLACALGACPSCWGDSEDCEDCGGQGAGSPGTFLPDPDCFRALIVPVLEVMVDQGNRRRRPRRRARRRPSPHVSDKVAHPLTIDATVIQQKERSDP